MYGIQENLYFPVLKSIMVELSRVSTIDLVMKKAIVSTNQLTRFQVLVGRA